MANLANKGVYRAKLLDIMGQDEKLVKKLRSYLTKEQEKLLDRYILPKKTAPLEEMGEILTVLDIFGEVEKTLLKKRIKAIKKADQAQHSYCTNPIETKVERIDLKKLKQERG